MKPGYFKENQYSHLVAPSVTAATSEYAVSTPLTEFAKRAQEMFLQGQKHLQHDELRLALEIFQELQGLILKTVAPKIRLDTSRCFKYKFPTDASIINALANRSAKILQQTPVVDYELPTQVTGEETTLPPAVQRKLKPAIESELRDTSPHSGVYDFIRMGLAAAADKDWRGALGHYERALEQVARTANPVRASLLHDIAILREKLNDRAPKVLRESVAMFDRSRQREAQAIALDTFAGMQARAGDDDGAAQFAKQAKTLRRTYNLHPVGVNVPPRRFMRAVSTAQAPALMGLEYLSRGIEQRTLTIRGEETAISIGLDRGAADNVRRFHESMADADSLDILMGRCQTPTRVVLHLSAMYGFLIPMALGDCLAGIGNLDEAEETYLSALAYPHINKKYELVRWWTRLAEVYLARGDELYRRAKDDPDGWAEAKEHYQKIVGSSGLPDATSPLYQDARLAEIKQRVAELLAAPDPTQVSDNPRVLNKVLRARVMLNQIEAGLDYFGFPPGYYPPFSFEYLQTTARYFAQNASQIERQYVQYKSTAENEEFRREQLDQQAELAAQTVVLEERGLAEAEAGIAAAQASFAYAETQLLNALAANQDFQNVRQELLEYAALEAWANASSVDKSDQIRLTINHHYYKSRRKKRNQVLKDLATQRTRLSHELESAKLEREIASATAYTAVAEAQLAQGEARRDVALQRIQIAELQQRHAEENRDFLDMKEFSARLWYELAREAKRLSRRYLDMAIEVALLMERAYEAETDRGLKIIRFDYGSSATNDLMAADRLLRDIDHFTLDHVTTIKSKKAPVKKTISLADARPTAFHRLKSLGQCFFQTELEDFDRQHPGLYLCKLQGVELVFVGITGATSLAGSVRNIGVSRFRLGNGNIVSRHYASDVMPLSQYDIRQDALAFRFSPNDLRLFENNGIDTMWQIDLPLDSNDFDFNEILDVQLVLYYNGFFSPSLEADVRTALPTSGSASRGFSARMMFPDELFYLKNQGEAELAFDAGMLPRNQTNTKRTDVTLKVLGDAAVRDGLTLRLRSAEWGDELVLVTDANGEVNDSTTGLPLHKLRDHSMIDTWTVTITKEDNPGLVDGDQIDLGGLRDLLVFFEYTFDYR